jgi:hypothetical protein
VLLLAQLLTSCGSDGESKACNAGDLHACTCGSSDAMGTQVCKDDNSGYEDCSCDGTGGLGGSGGNTSRTSNAPFSGEVGGPCNADSQCAGAPLICIEATANTEFATSDTPAGGGPQGGYCTVPCSTNSDCSAIDNVSVCNTALGYCFGLCIPGQSSFKCGSDRAQACVAVATDFGVCLPRCTSDAACGPGRFCDPGETGLCVDVQPQGGKVGDPCTVATEVTDCASGLCLRYADPNDRTVVAGSFCSASCTLGLANGCGFDDVAGGRRQAGCFQEQLDGGELGDLGLCFPLCDTTEDCAQAGNGWLCEPFGDVSVEQELGRLGECVPAVLANARAAAGPG